METFIDCEKFLDLHIMIFHVLLWLGHYIGRVFNDQQSIYVDGMELALYELALQDLSYLWCWGLPCHLLMVTM